MSKEITHYRNKGCTSVTQASVKQQHNVLGVVTLLNKELTCPWPGLGQAVLSQLESCSERHLVACCSKESFGETKDDPTAQQWPVFYCHTSSCPGRLSRYPAHAPLCGCSAAWAKSSRAKVTLDKYQESLEILRLLEMKYKQIIKYWGLTIQFLVYSE